ncbi:hypothetical protein PVAP13_9NG380500, partial [Panicum virgatum]
MDPSSPDFSPGITFSNMVLSQFGSPVISPSPDDAHNFWLLASFARSKLKLTVNNVDWIFKFTVFSRDVGLFVYKLGVVDNPLFKLAFNLWNERGMTLAESFISVSQGPQYHWGMPPSSFPSHFCQNHSPNPPTSAPLPFSIVQKTPTATVPPSSSCESLLRWNNMAYQFIDPIPFLPRGCTRIHVEGRNTMSRAVLGAPRRHNSDLAIIAIEPLPDAQVSFQSIRELGFRSIQPCPYGQAFVRLNYYHDRDTLIQSSPHNYGNYQISFRAHNRGWNNRTTVMNYDVWLMLLGFNIDYWEHKNVEKAISEFGKLLIWEEDPANLARVIVKARVVDLTEIPWFLVCSEGENFERDSWTALCEILQVDMLGGGPPPEDDPPNGPDDIQPNLSEFFGFGQPGHGPNNQNGLGPHANPPQVGNDVPNGGEAFLELNDLQVNINQVPHLNDPLEDDLGGIDELLNIAENMEDQAVFGPHPEDIIDAGHNTDSDSDSDLNPVQPLANPVVDVEVFIPLEQINPDEIQEEDLMDEDELVAIQQEEQQQNEQLHVEFVEIIEPQVNQMFASAFTMPKLNPETLRLWNELFSTETSLSVQILVSLKKAQVPSCQSKLSLPVIPKDLESYPEADQAVSPKDTKGKGILEESSPCTPEDHVGERVASSPGPWRSLRMLNLKKGYKEPHCSDKGCLGCTSVPPNLSPAIIKNFGASFCKLDEQDLSDAALTKKKKVAVLAPGKKESHAVHTSQRKADVPTTSGKK